MLFQKTLTYIVDIVILITMLYSIYLWIRMRYTEKQRYFFLFMIAVFLADTLGFYIRKIFKIEQIFFYFPYYIFSIFYFNYFFSRDYKDRNNKIFLNIISVVSLIIICFLQFRTFSLVIDNRIFFVIILFQSIVSLQWLLYIIYHIDEQNIINKQAFWVSCSLLVWGIFALFRLYLNKWLYDYDKDIFRIINYFFSFANILMYLFFLKGLKCVNYNILRTFNYFKK